MPLFITYASYSTDGAKGLLKKPGDRAKALQPLFDKLGARIVALYYTTGRNDVVLVSEAGDGTDAVALGMAVSASGALSNIETVRAWTSAEFVSVMEKAAGAASAYTPPGS